MATALPRRRIDGWPRLLEHERGERSGRFEADAVGVLEIGMRDGIRYVGGQARVRGAVADQHQIGAGRPGDLKGG